MLLILPERWKLTRCYNILKALKNNKVIDAKHVFQTPNRYSKDNVIKYSVLEGNLLIDLKSYTRATDDESRSAVKEYTNTATRVKLLFKSKLQTHTPL